MIEAVLWDNDGVLVDSEAVFFEVTRAAFVRMGLNLTPDLWGRHYLGEGKSSQQLAVLLGAESDHAATVLEERNREFRETLRQAPPVRPHVRETLSRLSGQVRMAMVTGCHRDQLQLVHATRELLKYFEAIVTGDECANPKPHPELYLAGLKALGVQPEHCLAVEDTPRGLASARAAGIACVVVPTDLTRHLNFPGALAVEEDVSAVLKHVQARRADA